MSGESGRDPYLAMLNTMRSEAEALQPLYFCLGTILAIGEKSIRVQADGQELDEEDLMINDLLRTDFQETAEITMEADTTLAAAGGDLSLSGQLDGAASPCGFGSHNYFRVDSVSNGRIGIHDEKASIHAGNARYRPQPRLRVGDTVLLIPSRDRQIYYLICKVVSYGAVSTH